MEVRIVYRVLNDLGIPIRLPLSIRRVGEQHGWGAEWNDSDMQQVFLMRLKVHGLTPHCPLFRS